MDIAIKASTTMTNVGSSGNEVQNLTLQRDQLTRQKEQIEENKLLTDEEKEKRVNNIETRIENIDRRIAEQQRKVEQAEQKKKIEQQQDTLELSVDPETAKMIVQLQQLTEMMTNSEGNLEDTTENSDKMQAISEVNAEKVNEKKKDEEE